VLRQSGHASSLLHSLIGYEISVVGLPHIKHLAECVFYLFVYSVFVSTSLLLISVSALDMGIVVLTTPCVFFRYPLDASNVSSSAPVILSRCSLRISQCYKGVYKKDLHFRSATASLFLNLTYLKDKDRNGKQC